MRVQKNSEKVAQVVMFENWLRFYFIVEEGDKLFMRLPEKAMEQIKNRYASYYDLAEILNNAEVDHQTSLKAVCLNASSGGDGAPLNEKDLADVFDSPNFQLELQLFGSWVQGHEEQLDQRFMEFSEWLKAYTLWKNTDEVRELSHKISQSLTFDRTDSGTVQ